MCPCTYVQVGEPVVDVVLGPPDVLHGLDVLLGLLQPVAELLLALTVQAVVVVRHLQVVAHVLKGITACKALTIINTATTIMRFWCENGNDTTTHKALTIINTTTSLMRFWCENWTCLWVVIVMNINKIIMRMKN
jgi:hypothetical protein